MYVPPTSDPLIRRVEALLAKAEATTFPAEAEAFVAKAQELMARHAIDDVVLRRSAGGGRDVIRRVAVEISPPYVAARTHLLDAVARNNGCRVVVVRGFGQGRCCQLFGHDRDVSNVLQLHAVLSGQAARALLDVPADRRVRSFRHAFHLAYAARINERLRAAAEMGTALVERERGASVALAVRDRRVAVDRAVAEEFPVLGTVQASASSAAGLVSGRAAADRAPLGGPGLPRVARLPHGGSRT